MAEADLTGDGIAAAIAALDDDALARHLLQDRTFRHPPPPDALPLHVARANDALEGVFRHVGETHRLGRGFDWRTNPSRDKEWLIAHHKLYALLDLAQAFRLNGEARFAAGWCEILGSWLRTMPSGFITASDAQVEAKRIESVVWSLLILRMGPAAGLVPGALLRQLLVFLARETRYVTTHLRPSRNHRTFQLASIGLVGALFPEIEDRDAWIALAGEGLRANLLKDFEPSGVHVERSTHYHNLALESGLGLVELFDLNGLQVAPDLRERLLRALEFSLFFQFPDGEIPLINDSDTLDHAGMFRAGERLFADPRFAFSASLGGDGSPPGQTCRDFSGYVVLRDGWGHDPASFRARQHVFIDCAPLGEGSHSHYDLFSFTWFAAGQQVVVDPGRYTYNAEPVDGVDWRREFKSTRFHNTVCIDGLDQTRYLSKARTPPPGVERYDRTKHPHKHGPEIERVAFASDLCALSPWVAGAARSHEYGVLHARAFVFLAQTRLVVIDLLIPEDGRTHHAASHLHFGAGWCNRLALAQEDNVHCLRSPEWSLAATSSGATTCRLTDGFVSKTYGEKERAPVLRMEMDFAALQATLIVLSPTADLPHVSVSLAPDGSVRAQVDETMLALSMEPFGLTVAGPLSGR
jgi:hypothetical protein